MRMKKAKRKCEKEKDGYEFLSEISVSAFRSMIMIDFNAY